MQPSGLIFLVIIAIWATFLLQHWVRRREHLATARSVDRFSDAMRVLERRTPLPELDPSLPQQRSSAVSPARPARTEVVVNRVQTSISPVSTRPAATVRATRTFHTLAGMSARRVRGLSLLASVSITLAVSPLAALSVLPWWSFPVALTIVIADFAWLRHAAVAEHSARRATASVRRSKAALGRTATPARRTASAATQPAPLPAPSEPMAVSGVTSGAEVAEQGGTAEADLSGWAPVPVPPPTYTLKARAERPEPAPAAVIEPAPAQPSSFDGLVDEDELDGLLDRRAAGA